MRFFLARGYQHFPHRIEEVVVGFRIVGPLADEGNVKKLGKEALHMATEYSTEPVSLMTVTEMTEAGYHAALSKLKEH